MRIDMSKITIQNFSYYAFNPLAPSLSQQDQKIALLATALLALTLGLGHIVCAIIYAVHKKDFEDNLIIPTVFRALENVFIPEHIQCPRPTYRNNEEFSYSSNEREIRNFEREARTVRDPLLRSGALLAADVGRGLNSLGRSMGIF